MQGKDDEDSGSCDHVHPKLRTLYTYNNYNMYVCAIYEHEKACAAERMATSISCTIVQFKGGI